MGLFSSIKKAFKKIFSGIKKVFKKVVGVVGKIAGSKWGKILLTAAAIFSGGMALVGGVQGWTAAAAEGAGFMGKFVSAAKGFMSALANPVDKAKELFGKAAGAGEVAAATGQTGAAAQKSAEITAQATQTAETAAIESAAAGAVPEAAAGGAKVAETAAQVAQAPGREAVATMFKGQLPTKTAEALATGEPVKKHWLTKAGEFAKEFVMSPTGAQVLGGAMTGMSEGAQLEAAMEHQDRIRRRWMDPQNELALLTQQPGFGTFGPIRRGGVPVFGPGGYRTSTPATLGGGGRLPGEPAPIG